MKRFLMQAALILACSATISAYDGNPCCIPQRRDPIICYYDCIKFTSQTFMFTRPVNQNLPMYQSLWHSLIYSEAPCSTAFQLFGFYQTSHSTTDAIKYFLMNRKTHLQVRGDDAPDYFNRDIRAEWLGINNSHFSGSMTIDPKQKQMGFAAQAYHALGEFIPIDLLSNWWLTIRLPVVMVENNINIRQEGVQYPGTSFPKDIIQAFNQPNWRFAKMNPQGQSKVGVAEINVQLGSTYADYEYFEFAYYSGFSVCLSGSQNASYLFSPFVGNNGHAAIETGVNLQVPLNCDTTCQQICWFMDLEAHWLWPNLQCRTFDLRGKPFSRYLQLNRLNGEPNQLIPAVNVLTREVRVHPYALCEFSTGWRYISEGVEAEIGYTLWGHGNEKLHLKCPFPAEYGIAGTGFTVDPSTGRHLATSASASTIANQAPNDPEFVTINPGDIDLLSAESRTAINHKIHLSFGWKRFDCGPIDAFFSFGGYYEWAQRNSALEVSGGWAKIGASF